MTESQAALLKVMFFCIVVAVLIWGVIVSKVILILFILTGLLLCFGLITYHLYLLFGGD